jgi:hypothetical protein
MRRTTPSGSEGDRTYRPSAGIAMQNRTGLGGVVDIRPLRVIITHAQDHMLLLDRGDEKKSLDLYGAFAGGVNRLAEYAARLFGARCWRQPGLGRGSFLKLMARTVLKQQQQPPRLLYSRYFPLWIQ